MNADELKAMAFQWLAKIESWLISPQFYAQVIIIAFAWAAARIVTRQLSQHTGFLVEEPQDGKLLKLRRIAWSCRSLLGPALLFLALGIGASVADAALGASWLVRIFKSLALVYVLYAVINRFLHHPVLNAVARWIGLPVAAIYALGYFDSFTLWLDGLAFQAGNIRISVLALSKAVLFGGVLFWLGRASSSAGQKVIREQQAVDVQTRELAAKALEIAIFAIVAILLLNILGLDLTAIAVFGGALGVGLGFGLQQIAAAFISGIILLLERSLKIGDFIELDDGKSGILKRINMRSSVLATYDGKEVVVPNDKFITSRFINWTNDDPRQRYEVAFSVSYDTDLTRVPPLVEAAISRHSQVLQEPEKPDVELRKFGDNGAEFAVEFWVHGIDDGKNKFSSDVRFIIWETLRNAGIRMPYPQREVHFINQPAATEATPNKKPRKD